MVLLSVWHVWFKNDSENKSLMFSQYVEASDTQRETPESKFHSQFWFFFLSRYDAGKDNYIDLMELKLMMEKLEAPQTHLGLKNMIKEVDEDLDNKLSFREVKQGNQIRLSHGMWCSFCLSTMSLCSSRPPQFLLIFRKAAAGELAEDSGLCVLARLSEIDVSTEGVKGAKTFFEAKVRWLQQTKNYYDMYWNFHQRTKQQTQEYMTAKYYLITYKHTLYEAG